MSLINKMLQELDKRHASQGVGAQPAARRLALNLRPVVSRRVGSEVFWRVIATAMLVLIVWLGWVMWQLTPRPIATDLAYQHQQRMKSVQQRAVPAAASEQNAALPAPGTDAATAPAAPMAAAEVASGVGGAAPAPGATPSGAKPEPPAQFDMLKLATAISTPIPERRPARSATGGTVDAAKAAAQPDKGRGDATAPAQGADKNAAGKAEAARTVAPTATEAKAVAAKPDESPAARPPAGKASQPVAALEPARIDKRVTSTPHERAEAEYRRAVSLVNQGRVSEGMEGFRSALAIEAAHEASRQTLVSLLMEQRRFDESFTALQQGLELHPDNSSFAMLLARILVERKDLNGALAVLQKHVPSAGGNADYHAFAAAIHQRLGRHSEAVEEYQTALRLSPRTGAWWVGLAISQEASDRRKEALSSFKRAQAIGNLSPELVAFVDQRLRQLQ